MWAPGLSPAWARGHLSRQLFHLRLQFTQFKLKTNACLEVTDKRNDTDDDVLIEGVAKGKKCFVDGRWNSREICMKHCFPPREYPNFQCESASGAFRLPLQMRVEVPGL